MGKKPKAKDQAPTPNFEKISRGLKNLQAQLGKAETLENLEKIKFTLIKLFDQLKTTPNTDKMNEIRIEMLKECNLNLQLLNQDEDIWILFKQHQVQQAYDKSILALKMLNNHPQRHWVKPWVRQIVQQTMQKIAELVTSLPTNQKNQLQGKEKGQTFVAPWEATASASPLPEKSSPSPVPPAHNTFRPNDVEQIFDNLLNPFPPISDDLLAQIPSRGDTFKPGSSPASTSNPIPSQSESIPPWNQDASQQGIDTMMPPNQDQDENSIQSFWDKDKEGEKTEKITPKSELDANSEKTKKIDSQESG